MLMILLRIAIPSQNLVAKLPDSIVGDINVH
jgi:hypothetical protein